MFEVDGKYAGRSRAVVIDNKDPNKRGRVRVRHPLLGDTVWINYLQTPGFYDVPKIGDVVYIECDCGYESHPIAWGNIVKGKDGSLAVPEEFQRVNPTNRGVYTPGGHIMEFDDGEGPLGLGKGVRLTTSGGIKIHALEGTPNEAKILAELPTGLKIEADGMIDSLKATTASGDSLELSATGGLQADIQNTMSLSMQSGQIMVSNSQASIVMGMSGSVTIASPAANLNITDSGDISVNNPTGAKLTISNSGDIELSNTTGSLNITAAGQVELKGAAAGVVELLIEAFQALSTQTASGFGAPTSTVADFAQLLAKAQTLKA